MSVTLRREDAKMNENAIGKQVVDAAIAGFPPLGVLASWRETTIVTEHMRLMGGAGDMGAFANVGYGGRQLFHTS